MIKPALLKLLTVWKTGVRIPLQSRGYEILESPIDSDEYLIRLSSVAVWRSKGVRQVVRVAHHFHTYGQGRSGVNPRGDEYQLKKLLDYMDAEFEQKWSNSIARLLKSKSKI